MRGERGGWGGLCEGCEGWLCEGWLGEGEL